MIRGGATHFWKARRTLEWRGRSLAVLLLGSCVPVGAASATETIDCASISMGHLDVALAAGSSTLRTVEMNEGDSLAFTFRADTRAQGTITLVAADGREQRLLYGPHATQISYTAERSGPVSFRLATKGGKVATFVMTCNPARGSGTMALDGLQVDMSVPLSAGVKPAPKDATAATAPEAKSSSLQWLGGEQPGKDAASGTYGVNLKLQPALMVGVLAQFDQAGDPRFGPAALSDQPWLAGPVTSVRLGGLSLDARAAWGPADPVAGHATDRQTLEARLTTKQEAGPWRFSPSIGFAHAQEKSGTAAEHAPNPGQQTTESGRVDVKPEVAYRIDMGRATYIEPKIMVGTYWPLGDVAGAGTSGASHEGRHMAETGITFGATDGAKLQLGATVQEGETSSDNVWSGKMQLNIPLK